MTSRRRPAAPRAPRGVVGWTVQILGELLITLGLVLLLFVGWQLWWTNIDADRAQAQRSAMRARAAGLSRQASTSSGLSPWRSRSSCGT
mgnify:CR=1 FL=1